LKIQTAKKVIDKHHKPSLTMIYW